MTKAEIIKRAAYLLGILRIGQALPADKNLRLDEAYEEVYDQLNSENIAIWDTEVPDRIVPHVVALMALNACDDFGVSPARYQRIVGKANVALREIRKHTQPEYVSNDDPEDF